MFTVVYWGQWTDFLPSEVVVCCVGVQIEVKLGQLMSIFQFAFAVTCLKLRYLACLESECQANPVDVTKAILHNKTGLFCYYIVDRVYMPSSRQDH